MSRPLSPKQLRFVSEYLIDLNATAAASRTGYSDPNYGRQLLSFPNVAEAIQESKAARSRRTEINADRVLEELAAIALSDIRDLMSWDEQRVRLSQRSPHATPVVLPEENPKCQRGEAAQDDRPASSGAGAQTAGAGADGGGVDASQHRGP